MILHCDSIQILLYQFETDFATGVSIAVIRLLNIETRISLSLYIHIYIYNVHTVLFIYELYQIIRLI